MFSDASRLDGRSRSKGLFKERVLDVLASPNHKLGKPAFDALWQTPDKSNTSIINELPKLRESHPKLS